MFNILYLATLVLNFVGVIFAVVFIWINIASGYGDTGDRSTNILTIAKSSMWLTILFALLSFLLANNGDVLLTIAKTSNLYSVVAISWLVVLIICVLGMLFHFVSKKSYKPATIKTLRKILKLALTATIISTLFSWLFS